MVASPSENTSNFHKRMRIPEGTSSQLLRPRLMMILRGIATLSILGDRRDAALFIVTAAPMCLQVKAGGSSTTSTGDIPQARVLRTAQRLRRYEQNGVPGRSSDGRPALLSECYPNGRPTSGRWKPRGMLSRCRSGVHPLRKAHSIPPSHRMVPAASFHAYGSEL